jgi:hypothetical protein
MLATFAPERQRSGNVIDKGISCCFLEEEFGKLQKRLWIETN